MSGLVERLLYDCATCNGTGKVTSFGVDCLDCAGSGVNPKAALPDPTPRVTGGEPVAWIHPNGAIWRADNHPAGMDFTQGGWIPLVPLTASSSAALIAERDELLKVKARYDNMNALLKQCFGESTADLLMRVHTAEAEIAALKADAKRYRWLRERDGRRSNRWPHVTQYPHQPEIDDFRPPQVFREIGEYRGEYLDEAIYAAMRATPEQLFSIPARAALQKGTNNG